MTNPFQRPTVGVERRTEAGLTPEEEADRELKKRKRRLRKSQESFQTHLGSLGPIQLQAPSLGGI